MSLDATTPVLAYAGLTVRQLALLASCLRNEPEQDWLLQPWLGRVGWRFVVLGGGPHAALAERCASAIMGRVYRLRESDSADHVGEMLRRLNRDHQSIVNLPNPLQQTSNSGGLLADLASLRYDAAARERVSVWSHPEAGCVVASPRSGWVHSTNRVSDALRLGRLGEWRRQDRLPDSWPQCAASLESWIFGLILRERNGVAGFPDGLSVEMVHFPDVVSVTGQPRLFNALVAMNKGLPLGQVAISTGCARPVVDALVTALALAGLVKNFALLEPQIVRDAGPAPVNPDGDRRTARQGAFGLRQFMHFLGISRAPSR